jgi:hypothetical protein
MDLNKVELEELYLIKQLLENNLDKPVIESYNVLLEYYWNNRNSFKEKLIVVLFELFKEKDWFLFFWLYIGRCLVKLMEDFRYLCYKKQLKTIIKPILKKYKKRIYKIIINELTKSGKWDCLFPIIELKKEYIIEIFLDKNLYFQIYHRISVDKMEFELKIKLSYSFEKEEKYISEDRLSEFIKILEKINQENINIDDLISKKGESNV